MENLRFNREEFRKNLYLLTGVAFTVGGFFYSFFFFSQNEYLLGSILLLFLVAGAVLVTAAMSFDHDEY